MHTDKKGILFRNLILGGQDGLVNVLGIVLGVAVATYDTSIIILAGLAATFAESLSMAAVAYTSSRAELEHYKGLLKQEEEEIEKNPSEAKNKVKSIYQKKGFKGELLNKIIDNIAKNKKRWVETIVREGYDVHDPEEKMTPTMQGIIVGGSAIIGSFIPLIPFFFLTPEPAMYLSLAVSLISLFAFGAYKSYEAKENALFGGLEMMIIGGLAAFAGFLVGVFFQV